MTESGDESPRKLGSRIRRGALCTLAAVLVVAGVQKYPRWKSQVAPVRLVHDSSSWRHLDSLFRQYRLLFAHEISSLMVQWKTKYPNFLRVTTAQERYGLPRAGGPLDCPFDGGRCLNYMFTIQDYIMHPEGSESSNRLPEVFLSGTVHGNERVGPTAVLEAAALLLEAATCEANQSQDQDAMQCREGLALQGVDDARRRQLARIVATRRIVVVPTANAEGYFKNQRGERTTQGSLVDPNTDFPFDVSDRNPANCMKTVAARVINEVYREHMFQLSLTFHAGIQEVIGYEWGNPAYLGYQSPDNDAQAQLASAYSAFAGTFEGAHPYDWGTMNEKVYWLHGAMEDWAYASSFDPELVTRCSPATYGGYPQAKTAYNDSMLRSFTMLVETSLQSTPLGSTLGTNEDLFNTESIRNGHVSRNIRMSILAAELVEPYVTITGLDSTPIPDDIVPGVTISGRAACQDMKRVTIDGTTDSISVEWTVGGAITIDDTSLWYGKWEDIPESVWQCMSQPSQDITPYLTKATSGQNAVRGTGYYSSDGPIPAPGSTEVLGPVFSASIDVSQFVPGDEIVVFARSRVDSSWTNQELSVVRPAVPPQSHIVNARTNSDWYHENEGKIIRGRLDWYTVVPLTITVGNDGAVSGADRTCQPEGGTCGGPADCCSTRCFGYSESKTGTCLKSAETAMVGIGGRGRGRGQGGAAGRARAPGPGGRYLRRLS